MAQTLHSSPPGRISQLLPTVKCSNCTVLVPLTELGEHICAPAPALPKPSSSPSSLLPTRLQALVSRRSQTLKSRESNVPERRGTPSIKAPPPARLNSPGPSSAPPFAQPNTAQLSPGWNLNRVPSPLSGGSDGGGSSRNDAPLRERLRSTSDSKEPPTPFAQQRQRTLSTGRREPHPPQPPPSPIVRNRTPSNDSRRPTTPLRPSRDSRPSQDLRNPNTPLRPSFDNRPSNDTRAPSTPLRPSFDTRPSNDARSPSRNPSVDTRSSNDTRASSRQPSVDTRPSDDMRSPSRRPSFDTRSSDDTRASSARPSVDHFSSSDRQRPPRERRPSAASVRPPPRQGTYALDVVPPTGPSPTSPAPPRSPALSEPDTKVGGDAGMAGVGRRGFAAAAHAARFATATGHVGGSRYDGGFAPEGTDDRRPNAPKYLDINTASSSYSAGTPPLSPNSGYSSHSPGPRSPISPHGGHLSTTRSSTSTTKGGVSPAIVRTPSPGSANRAAFFDKFKDKIPPVDTRPYEPIEKKGAVGALPSSPSTGSEYGLAYADSTDDEGGELVQRLPSPPPSAPPPTRNRSFSETKANLVRFPSVDEKTMSALKKSASSSSGSSGSRFLFGSTRQSSLSGRNRSNSGSASNYSRSTARSTHALEKAMETLLEEGSSATGSSATNAKAKNGRSNTIPRIPPQSPEHKAPKLPMRSLTSPSSATFEDSKRKKKKECMKCDKTIDDGRWIQTDAGGVLCEKCWKNMYLPKCRRCTKPIEKQAVSSSDGQLKGKYHRECFNCHTCHKPFPDKEFYVLDGKPLCAYHYHEANESLCASCGQPIEGPCAVSHTGQRYHPEHLSCEYPGCKVTLDEYWEADGKMMCERHANIVGGYSSEDYEGRLGESKAQRRITRFIDLASGADSDDLR